VVVANELPNKPHLESEVVGQYPLAKIKEAVLAITGG
jgi:pyruvate dehydrogenase (quinone)